jgi:hypothetical protein
MEMIRVCCYKGCGVVYGEKEPLSDKQSTHGLCPKHLEISLTEIRAEMKKKKGEGWHGNHPDHHSGPPAHRRPAYMGPQ